MSNTDFTVTQVQQGNNIPEIYIEFDNGNLYLTLLHASEPLSVSTDSGTIILIPDEKTMVIKRKTIEYEISKSHQMDKAKKPN